MAYSNTIICDIIKNLIMYIQGGTYEKENIIIDYGYCISSRINSMRKLNRK